MLSISKTTIAFITKVDSANRCKHKLKQNAICTLNLALVFIFLMREVVCKFINTKEKVYANIQNIIVNPQRLANLDVTVPLGLS